MVCSIVLSAQTTKTWTGAENSSWSNENNWSPKGEPGKDDHVVIPSGTPPAEISYSNQTSASEAKTVTNNGTMYMNGGVLCTSQFTNNGDVAVKDYNPKDANVIKGEASSDQGANVTNNGVITTGTFGGGLVIQGNTVENSGTIEADGVKINASGFINQQGGVVSSTGYKDNVTITCTNSVINHGTITTSENNQSGVSISANLVNNDGTISTGNGESDQKSGNIQIAAKHVTNEEKGAIRTGNCIEPENQGKVNIKGKVYNYGKISSGKSPGSDYAGRSDQYFNHVDLVGDSIFLFGDSTRIEADTLRIWFNYLEIAFVTQYACIWGDMVVEFYGSEGAVANLSSPDIGAGIISIGYGGIAFFCDNILEPPLGLNYICDLPPTVAPSDTAITGASVSEGFGVLQTGTSGLVQVAFQNQSTLPKAFQYSITDQNGWVQDASGTTAQVESFLFDSLTINYTIPNNPSDSVPDTVFILLSHGGESILAEAIWVLYSYQEALSGGWEADGKRRDLIETFPVPFAEDLTIRALEDVFITILDPMGRVILREQLRKSNIFTWTPAENYTGGLYLIVAENERTGTEVDRVMYQPK